MSNFEPNARVGLNPCRIGWTGRKKYSAPDLNSQIATCDLDNWSTVATQLCRLVKWSERGMLFLVPSHCMTTFRPTQSLYFPHSPAIPTSTRINPQGLKFETAKAAITTPLHASLPITDSTRTLHKSEKQLSSIDATNVLTLVAGLTQPPWHYTPPPQPSMASQLERVMS